jgi:hypothetical protein
MKNEIFRDLKLNNFLIIYSGCSNTALSKFIYIEGELLNIYSIIEVYTLSGSRLGTPLKLEDIEEKDKARFRIL